MAILLNESPRIIENARQAKKVLTVIMVAMKGAEPSPTDAAQASVNEPTPCILHALPMILKLYAEIIPIRPSNIVAGSKAFEESENAAIPDGKLNTPAPRITLARLKMPAETSAVPCGTFFFAKAALIET